MLLLCRFEVPDDQAAEFVRRAEHALRLLTAQTGCEGAELGRATESSTSWVLSARFASVADYRRSMGGFEVREQVIPLLSEAKVDDPAAYEVIVAAGEGQATRNVSLLAKDGGTVRLGEAGGEAEPR